MQKQAYHIINTITIYRCLAAPILLGLMLYGQLFLFKWLLAFSFFTDAIDGFLARRYRVCSVLGARLDSIGDDLTVLVAAIGLYLLKRTFIYDQIAVVSLLLFLFFFQFGAALVRYGKSTSFHTYLAKLAAVLQGIFLVTAFFTSEPSVTLFYAAAAVTALQLAEELVLVWLMPRWQANVKGVYWIFRQGRLGANPGN